MNAKFSAQWLGPCLILLLATMASFSAGASATSFCWKDSYGRGVGTIPDACPSGTTFEGALCYKPCPSGYTSSALGACIQTCPKGMRDDGAFCRQAEYHVKEFPWQFGDPLDDSKMFARCESEFGKGNCEKRALVVVEKCKAGYEHIAGFCRPKIEPDCAALGMGGKVAGLSCTKKSVFKDPQTANCGAGKEYDAGLCYDNCKYNMEGVGPVCWDKCANTPLKEECAAGCAKDQAACATETTNMVMSVLDSAVSIGSTIATLGIAGGIKAGVTGAAKTSAKQAVKEATKKASFKAFKQGIKKVGPSVFKETVKSEFKGLVVKKGWEATGYAAQAAGAAGNVNSMIGTVDSVMNEANMSEEEKDFMIAQNVLGTASMFDPTGVVGVVAAFTKPKCSVLAQDPPPTKSAGFTNSGIQSEEQYGNIKRAQAVLAQAMLETAQEKSRTVKTAMDALKNSQLTPLTTQLALEKHRLTALKQVVDLFKSKEVSAAYTVRKDLSYIFYKDGSYARFTPSLDSGYPTAMPGGFKNLPNGWASFGKNNLDAMVAYRDSGSAYLFKNVPGGKGDYARMSNFSVDANYPRTLPGGWQNLPGHWTGIDAGFYSELARAVYLFRGEEYVRISSGVTVDSGYPRKIVDAFGNIPWDLRGSDERPPGIDAATVRSGKIYLFRGQEYVRIPDIAGQRNVEAGYPKSIWGNWRDGTAETGKSLSRLFSEYESSKTRIASIESDIQKVKSSGGLSADAIKTYEAYKAEWERAKGEEWTAYQNKLAIDKAATDQAIKVGWQELQEDLWSCMPKTPPAVSIDTNYYYRLSTVWQGEGKSLDVNSSNMSAKLSDTSRQYTGSYWKLSPVGNGYFQLSNRWQGSWTTLDVEPSAENNVPVMRPKGNYTGQFWQLTPVPGRADHYYLTTAWQGPCRALDIVPDGANDKPRLRNATEATGQMWKFTKTNVVAKATPKISSVLTRNGTSYLFLNDGTYSRISADRFKSGQTGPDSGFPKAMPGGLKNVPSWWIGGREGNIGAVVPYPDNSGYFFFANARTPGEYARVNGSNATVSGGYPRSLPGGWGRWPSHWNGVDAGIFMESRGVSYMFRGDEYIRVTGINVDVGYPRKIADSFVGLPKRFHSNIDAATIRNGHIYFFKEGEYVRFDQGNTRMSAGYPKAIMGVWM